MIQIYVIGCINLIINWVLARVEFFKFIDQIFLILKKFIWYGKGDAQFVWYHKERTLSILKHITYNYPIKKTQWQLKNKKINLVPFFVMWNF